MAEALRIYTQIEQLSHENFTESSAMLGFARGACAIVLGHASMFKLLDTAGSLPTNSVGIAVMPGSFKVSVVSWWCAYEHTTCYLHDRPRSRYESVLMLGKVSNRECGR